MKKSEAFRIAADSVIDSEYNNNIRLEVLKVLLKEEELALFAEAREEAAVSEE
jgi:hypothetical protein